MRCKNIYFFLNYIKRIRNFVLKMNEMNNQPQAASSHDLPKVSVVMCTYNGGRFLAEQLESIIRQTYPVYEIIVQDDGSTDNTQAVVEEYARLYPFIRFYRHEGKPGINRNFFQRWLAQQENSSQFQTRMIFGNFGNWSGRWKLWEITGW